MYLWKVASSSLRFHCVADPCQALLVSSSRTGCPVGPLVGLFNELLITPWAHLCSYSLHVGLLRDSKKKDTFKVNQRISPHYLGEGHSLPETDKLKKTLKFFFSWSRILYNLHSIFSLFYYFQMMRSDFIIYSTYTIKWEVNKGQVVCQKTSKTQTLHVTVYFYTPLEVISRSATPSFDFSMPCIRLMLSCLYLFGWILHIYICSPKYIY